MPWYRNNAASRIRSAQMSASLRTRPPPIRRQIHHCSSDKSCAENDWDLRLRQGQSRSDSGNSEHYKEIPGYPVDTCPRGSIRKQLARVDSDDNVWPYSRQDVANPNQEETEQHHNQPVSWERNEKPK